MADSPSTPSPSRARPSGLQPVAVSRYDRVSGMLLATLIMVGLLVTFLLTIWLSTRVFTSQAAVPLQIVDYGEGSEEDPWGPGNDIEPPPSDGTDAADDQEEVVETLETVSDTVATRSAILEHRVSRKSTGHGRGGGGTGTGRKGKPRRWRVMFGRGNSVETYAKQLDFFGIELGVKTGSDRMEYAYNLSQKRPNRRVGTVDEENARKRYYLAWIKGDLQDADRQLLANAGIQAGDNPVLKFLPPAVEQQLYTLEQSTAGGRQVFSTLFGVEPEGAGFRFYVIRQN